MKNLFTIFLITFILFGMLLPAGFVLASHDGDSDNSGSGSDEVVCTQDVKECDDGTFVSRNPDLDCRFNLCSDEKDDDDDGRRERTEIRIRDRDGEIRGEFKREIITADGKKIKIERKIRIRNGEIEIRTRLKVEGEGSNLSVTDSEGKRHRIRVTPEKLRILMEEILGASNITDFSIEEVKHKNIPRVVFKINSDHPGRFLGIFKILMRAETLIDSETGEIIDVNLPWWAFFIIGEGSISDVDEIIGNDTLEDEVVANDEELEEEFGDIEIDEELEIKAETLDGSAEIKIELEFETKTTNIDNIILEVLSKLTLTSEEINSFLEIEISDDSLREEEKLEFEIDFEDDDLTEVEFELKFTVDNDNREDLVNLILDRLFLLTTDEILGALEIDDDDSNEDEEKDEDDDKDEVEKFKGEPDVLVICEDGTITHQGSCPEDEVGNITDSTLEDENIVDSNITDAIAAS